MKKTLIKILKISRGISQLFCAMDKGFRKVESDIELIKEFRHLCYHANENLEVAHKDLTKVLCEYYKDDQQPLEDIAAKVISSSLKEIRSILEENIISINTYIEDYSSVWKKTLSINALNKFKSLLEKEYEILDKEVEKFLMELIYQERVNILHNPGKVEEKDKNQ